MAVPRQMTAHTLEAPKGWFRPAAVDYTAPFDATDLATIRAAGWEAWAGRCVHVDPTSGGFKLGATLSESYFMPMWLFPNSDDPDVENPGPAAATEPHTWVAAGPSAGGHLTALVAIGAYELATTEFDATQTYNINQLLYSATGTTAATSGVMTNQGVGGAVYPAVQAVGMVSRGRASWTAATRTYGADPNQPAQQMYPSSPENAHREQELFFWPILALGLNGTTEPTWAT
jgi:hypothetical protein